MTVAKSKPNVGEFIEKLDYPLKAEVQALREIILAVSPKITEQIKWNAPSFSYKDYIVTFNLHDQQQLRLIFHNPAIATIKSEILEGDYPDRRIVYIAGMSDVQTKKAALEYVIDELLKIMDA